MSYAPYPILKMPRIFCDAVIEINQRTGIDTAAIATTLLASFSLAASTQVRILVESGFVIPPALFVQIIAESGFGKSILDSYAQEPFKEHEKASTARKEENKKQFEGELLIWSEKKKAQLCMYRKALKNGDHVYADQLEKNIQQHEDNKPLDCEVDLLTMSDSTPSAIKKRFAGIGNVGGIILSEGSVAFKGGRIFSEPGLLCNLYDGTSFQVDRATDGSVSIIDPAAAMLLFSQTKTFNSFCVKQGEEMLGNGVFQRMLFYFAEQNGAINHVSHYVHDKRCLEEFQNIIRAMLIRRTGMIKKQDSEKRLMKFTPEASHYYQGIKQRLKYDTLPMGPLESFKGFAAKYTNNMMRIACLFHLMEGGESDIKKDSVEQANELCYWYLQQAMMYFDENRKFEAKAYQLYDWIIKQLNTYDIEYYEKTKLYQYIPNHLRGRGKTDIQPLLDLLIAQKMLMTDKVTGVGTVIKKFSFGF